MIGHVVDEERSGDPFPDRAPLQIGKCHHDGVDLARVDVIGEGLHAQHGSTLVQAQLPVQDTGAPRGTVAYSGVT